jgi:bifunctional non-homologous end joining protein LigD
MMEIRIDDRVIRCSSTDRIVFPDVGLTKGDVIGYYRDVAALMVPELLDRPLTFERFNKGIAGEGYYQKHAPKYFPDWIERVEVKGKTPVRHALCNEPAALVYLANQNALTFHVPTVRRPRLDRPDRIVFDLDPPEGRFDLARAAARAVGDLMAELELPTRIKTTGSKGLHVVVPLAPEASYDEVYRFAVDGAALLARRHPDRFTTEFYKKDRAGRLYLDADRNHAGATAVAPYSIRARPGAPVSLPIRWSELDDAELRPDGTGVRELPRRLDAVGDLWADLDAEAAALGPARERLASLISCPI